MSVRDALLIPLCSGTMLLRNGKPWWPISPAFSIGLCWVFCSSWQPWFISANQLPNSGRNTNSGLDCHQWHCRKSRLCCRLPESLSRQQWWNAKWQQRYTIHFDKDALPPTQESNFWSITAYTSDNFLINNELNRYCINDRSGFTLNEDGSLDILVQSNAPWCIKAE